MDKYYQDLALIAVEKVTRRLMGASYFGFDSGIDVGNPLEMKGIYKRDGNQLVYCWAYPGNPRPDDFTTPKGSNQTLVTLDPIANAQPLPRPADTLFQLTSSRRSMVTDRREIAMAMDTLLEMLNRE